jgi:hypothetical protein
MLLRNSTLGCVCGGRAGAGGFVGGPCASSGECGWSLLLRVGLWVVLAPAGGFVGGPAEKLCAGVR